MKKAKKSTQKRVYVDDAERLAAIAKAFNLPQIKAFTKVLDVFEESGKSKGADDE